MNHGRDCEYIVVRDGVELEQEFLEKKEAEAHDKMLDAAQAQADLIKQGELRIDAEPRTIDDISIFLAKNALAVTTILKSVKQVNPEPKSGKKTPQAEPEQNRQKVVVALIIIIVISTLSRDADAPKKSTPLSIVIVSYGTIQEKMNSLTSF